jgi:integrase
VTLTKKPGGWETRLRYGAGQRGRFLICVESAIVAKAREARLQAMATKLAAAGKHAEARVILTEAAAEPTESEFAKVERMVDRIAAEAPAAAVSPKAPGTFRDVAELWLSGELHRLYPDRVGQRHPDTVAKDRGRLAVIAPAIGHKALDSITLADARAAMALVPVENKQGTRRLYARLIYRVMKLARYPLEAIEQSPIPAEFVPPQGDPPLFQFLRPEEEFKLITYPGIPLATRLAYGLMSREGFRTGGIAILRWSHIDLESGLIVHKHKTRRPRRWKLGDDVLRALNAWRDVTDDDSPLVLPGFKRRDAAGDLRRHLLLAGVARQALHESGDDERRMRAHDLRATFVTLALANGRSESWVQDRTGHAGADTMNLYRRLARQAEEMSLPWLHPLDDALRDDLFLGQMVGQEAKFYGQMPTQPSTGSIPKEPRETPREPKTATSSSQGSTEQHGGPAGLSGVGQDSPVELALAAALTAAIAAQRWDVALEITRELGERRRSREQPAVASIDAARRRKNGDK